MRSFTGSIDTISDTKSFEITLNDQNFLLPGTFKTTVLGFQVRSQTGSALDPASVTIQRRASDGTLRAETPLVSSGDLANREQSLVLVELSLGSYVLTTAAERGSTGAFVLDVYLVGDANGNRSVDINDGLTIRGLIGVRAGDSRYRVEADCNLDGRIDTNDYLRWRSNFDDTTNVNPLSLSLTGITPASISLPGGTQLVNSSSRQLNGVTNRAASVSLAGSDAVFGSSIVAATDGSFSLPLLNKLAEGNNTIQVRARESFGQERFASLSVALIRSPRAECRVGSRYRHQ